MFDVLGITGRDFALEAHREVHQLYDGYLPYEFHLRLAAKTAVDFIGLLKTDGLQSDIVVSATWCHDVIEDTFRTYNDVKNGVGIEVADIAYAVTNEKGRTRKERANAAYYEGIRNTPFAVYVKLCDRIANVTYGRYISPNKGKFEMYKKENDKFIEQLGIVESTQTNWTASPLTPMIAHLRNLLRG